MSKKTNRIDRTFPMGAFRREASELLRLSQAMSDTDLHVLLIYLSRDKRMAFFDENVRAVFSAFLAVLNFFADSSVQRGRGGAPRSDGSRRHHSFSEVEH